MTKVFSVLGDSISTFEDVIPRGWRVYYAGDLRAETGVCEVVDTWWMQVIEHFKGKLVANASFSGSLVEGSGFPAASSDERVRALGGSKRGGHGACAAPERPDAVLVFIGINDYGWGGACAQTLAHGNALPAFEQVRQAGDPVAPGAVGPEAPARFGQAYQDMLAKIRHEFPRAEVWCVTLVPGRVRGEAQSTFAYNLRGGSY